MIDVEPEAMIDAFTIGRSVRGCGLRGRAEPPAGTATRTRPRSRLPAVSAAVGGPPAAPGRPGRLGARAGRTARV